MNFSGSFQSAKADGARKLSFGSELRTKSVMKHSALPPDLFKINQNVSAKLKHFSVLWLRGLTSHSFTALEAPTDHTVVSAWAVLCGLLGMEELCCVAGRGDVSCQSEPTCGKHSAALPALQLGDHCHLTRGPFCSKHTACSLPVALG